MRVLIVDDDDLALALLENILVTSGYEVEKTDNGRHALRLLAHGDCRMVITDWQMPKMNGLELCRAIRSQNLSEYVYIILLTSHHGRKEQTDGLAVGADDFAIKPFDTGALIACLRAGEQALALESRDAALFALARLLESRHGERAGHLERVQNYCRLLAQQLAGMGCFQDSIDAEFIRSIHRASPLHDIGVCALPDALLRNTGVWNALEIKVMRTHATMGARTFAAALRHSPRARFLRMAYDIAGSHHERYDGRGYPAGLRGEEIPLSGRIVALADTYDALTSEHAYRPAVDHQTARAIILDESAKQFDPLVVEAFLQLDEPFTVVHRHITPPVAQFV